MHVGGVKRSFQAWHYVYDNPRDEAPFTSLKGGRIELIDFDFIKTQFELKNIKECIHGC